MWSENRRSERTDQTQATAVQLHGKKRQSCHARGDHYKQKTQKNLLKNPLVVSFFFLFSFCVSCCCCCLLIIPLSVSCKTVFQSQKPEPCVIVRVKVALRAVRSVARWGGRASPWVRCWRDAERCREDALPRREGGGQWELFVQGRTLTSPVTLPGLLWCNIVWHEVNSAANTFAYNNMSAGLHWE